VIDSSEIHNNQLDNFDPQFEGLFGVEIEEDIHTY
jgi:hypothetical protein